MKHNTGVPLKTILFGSFLLSQIASASILPENELHLEDSMALDTNVSEEQFNEILDRVGQLYRPQFHYFGAKLHIERDWDDSMFNAQAYRSGDTWAIKMFGGLARRPETTLDGFTLVICHEIGHHLGGFPFIDSSWAASEGQADYYATQSCAGWLWQHDFHENEMFRENVHAVAKEKCDRAWEGYDLQNLCYRVAMASESLARLLGRADSIAPSFDRTDTTVVAATDVDHPVAQCRLDTYLAGALCSIFPELDIIPGLDVQLGRDSVYAEMESARNNCIPASSWSEVEGYNQFDKPNCWFKPKLIRE